MREKAHVLLNEQVDEAKALQTFQGTSVSGSGQKIEGVRAKPRSKAKPILCRQVRGRSNPTEESHSTLYEQDRPRRKAHQCESTVAISGKQAALQLHSALDH